MEKSTPKIGGEIHIGRSSFYLPAVLERIGIVGGEENEKKPILVELREQNAGTAQSDTVIKVRREMEMPGFLDRLEGNLSIRIPRNTWIRNRQLRIELEGDLNLRMDGGEQYLSGPVQIVRGQYDLLGRRFTVVEGKIEFLGSRELNPPILLEAEYTYRTSGREKKVLTLLVTGNFEQPLIRFYVDNSEISEEDAVSIVLYGRRKDELSFGSQSELAGSDFQNTAAMGIISNLISDKLSRSVGDDLNLDVIEVNAQDNWQSANFIVGKYITEDIFVTYKREFGQNNDNNIVPETISLEYEMTKFLYLQLIQGDPKESGADVFFKLDWK
jgi:autotransporter translocation and assembly factor TamB